MSTNKPYVLSFATTPSSHYFLKNYDVLDLSRFGFNETRMLASHWEKIEPIVAGIKSAGYGDKNAEAFQYIFDQLAKPLFLAFIEHVTEVKGYRPIGVLLSSYSSNRYFDHESGYERLRRFFEETDLAVFKLEEVNGISYIDEKNRVNGSLSSLKNNYDFLEKLVAVERNSYTFANSLQCNNTRSKEFYLLHKVYDGAVINGNVGLGRQYTSIITRLIRLLNVFPESLFKDNSSGELPTFELFDYVDTRQRLVKKHSLLTTTVSGCTVVEVSNEREHATGGSRELQLTLNISVAEPISGYIIPIIIGTLGLSYEFIKESDTSITFLLHKPKGAA